LEREVHFVSLDWPRCIEPPPAPDYGILSLEVKVEPDFQFDDLEEFAHNIPRRAIIKCQHCGQYAARYTACVHCGAPVD
jgi:hypothetical protein